MFHLEDTGLIESCVLRQCERIHYTELEDAKEAAEQEKLAILNAPLPDFKQFDRQINQYDAAVAKLARESSKIARKLGFTVRSYYFLTDLEICYDSLKVAYANNNKKTLAKTFFTSYLALKDVNKKMSKMEEKYLGWARYYKEENNSIIHNTNRCLRLRNSLKESLLIANELSGINHQQLYNSEQRLCGFCFPNINKPSSEKTNLTQLCPNSGTSNYKTVNTPINFSLRQGVCSECSKELSITKTGLLRKHYLRDVKDPEDKFYLLLKGENNCFSWEIIQEDTNFILKIVKNDEIFSEYLSKKIWNNIAAEKEKFENFIIHYGQILINRPYFNINLTSYNNFELIDEKYFKEIDEEEDIVFQAELLYYSRLFKEQDLSALKRMLIIKKLTQPEFMFFQSNPIYTIDLKSKLSLDKQLDFLDFLHNGKRGQTFNEFNLLHSGRSFTYNEKPRGTQYNFGNEVFFSFRSLYLVPHRYHQLSNRSQKLKKLLNSLTLEEILNALESEIPGWLLVDDTIKMIESAKNNRGTVTRNHANGYQSYDERALALSYGDEIIKNIASLGKIEEFRTYTLSTKVISDASQWQNRKSFIIHAFNVLGIEETLRMLEIICHETEGISARAFNKLVNQGGFIDEELPEAWEIMLLEC